MKHLSKIIILATIILISIGCGQSQEVSAGTESSPSGKVANTVAFTCSEVSSDGFELSHTEATRYKMTAGDKQYYSIVVFMANYDRQGGSYHPNAKGDQKRVMLSFAAPSGEELAPGRYSLDANMGEGHRLSIGIEGGEGDCGLGNGQEGFGEITRIDDKTIEGRVSVKDAKGTSIEATFSTEYGISRY